MPTEYIAGLFALLGAFAGAALTRRTEYEKWLRQERAQAFGVLINEVHETRLFATNEYYEGEGTEQERSTRVTEAFTKLGRHVGVARLYMSNDGRGELSEVVQGLWINCTSQGGPASRVIQLKAQMERLQKLLEGELSVLPWSLRFPKRTERRSQ